MIEFGCLILFVQPDGEENNISFLISKFFLLWHEFYLKLYLLWLLYQGKRRKYMSGLFEKNQLYLLRLKHICDFCLVLYFWPYFGHHCNLIFYPASSACEACAPCLCCLPGSWIFCIKYVLSHSLSTQHCTHRNPSYICTGLTDSPLQRMRQAKERREEICLKQ